MKKVLVVEDSRAFSQIISALLQQRLNIESDIAETTDDALDLLNANPHQYMAITTDLHLPGSENGEIIFHLEPYQIPIIVLTGNLTDSMRETVLRNESVCDYLIKSTPGAFENVVSLIHRLQKNPKLTALIVDDSKPIAQLLTKVLKAQKLHVLTADNAEQALKMAKEYRIHLVLTDGELGGMDGITLTHELRRQFNQRQMVIIGISGVYSRDKSIRFLKAGANDFLTKPIVIEELVARINQNLDAMDYSSELQEITEHQQYILRMAAHDIRNPLANIYSLSQMLMLSTPENDARHCHIKLINQSTDNLIKLLTKLTEFSHINGTDLAQSATLQPSHLLLKARLEEFNSISQAKGIHFELQAGEEVQVKCDAEFIIQVVSNFVTNAFKFSLPGTLVKLTAKVKGNQWLVSVEDQGPGISIAQQKLLFKPFAKLENKPTGGEQSTGLGLAICKKLIEAHDGEIGYQKLDKGSQFYFSLPLASQAQIDAEYS
ncbi:hypothetical protein C2869_15085 [Saccharobesus litoralis]|uniref:histidine kinase n=1 Tax=Saccharobesus litoralis TaxID=2172099 RepID=A0A2S0VTY7_9ALTE|nr:hybrid sensor histidine kinase/response regulator [Saccharobesus litoralis]AWB67681.1 hypothetical protein C2869_15085 [Saccharobesus litoralis]